MRRGISKKERLKLAKKCNQMGYVKPKRKPYPRKRYGRFSNFSFDDLENIIDTMPTNEQTALALGFYNYGDSIADELENGEFDDFVDYVDDDFESFDDDEDDGFMIEGDDEFMIEGDDEFDNVITDGDDWIGMEMTNLTTYYLKKVEREEKREERKEKSIRKVECQERRQEKKQEKKREKKYQEIH